MWISRILKAVGHPVIDFLWPPWQSLDQALVSGRKVHKMTQLSQEDMTIKHPLLFSYRSSHMVSKTLQWQWKSCFVNNWSFYYLLKWGNGGIFLYSFAGALSPCTLWNKTKTQHVVFPLFIWQWGACESGYMRALCCNIHLGKGLIFEDLSILCSKGHITEMFCTLQLFRLAMIYWSTVV